MSATLRLVSRLTTDRLPSSRTYASDRFCEMTTLTGLLPTWMVGGGAGAAPATLGSAKAATRTAPAPKRRRCMQTPSRKNPRTCEMRPYQPAHGAPPGNGTGDLIAGFVWSITEPGTVACMDEQDTAML